MRYWTPLGLVDAPPECLPMSKESEIWYAGFEAAMKAMDRIERERKKKLEPDPNTVMCG